MLNFNYQTKQKTFASIKATFSINFPFYVFALGILLAFLAFQCEDEEIDCNTTEVTAKELASCVNGLWGNIWLDDGTEVYLIPYSIDENAKVSFQESDIKDDTRLRVCYTLPKSTDERYGAMCTLYQGNFIHIKSVEILNK